MAKMTAAQTESMMQARCEVEKMFNNGLRGLDAMKACGETVGK